MKDEESQKSQTTATSCSRHTCPCSAAGFCIKKYGQGFEELFTRGKYRFWALAAIVLLAFWSMFTGSVTLKLSAVDLKLSSHDLDSSTHADLDVLDVDAREKMVKEMWKAYKYSSVIRLPSFFRDAFGAAYQDLTSEVSGVRDAALLEITKMSLMSTDFYETSSVQSTTW